MERPAPFMIVGIGASAGGLEAFSELLEHLPPDTGMAFVLVQHLAPDHKSVLADILARATSMPVVEAADGMEVAPDTVYVMPAGQDLTIEQGVLRLSARPASGHHLPVDAFFASLALDRGDRAIAVVLSGTASDGSEGVRAVKARGGATIAQDPLTAKYQGMPQSAIATGAVDMVLAAPLIAARLAVLGSPVPPGAPDPGVLPVPSHDSPVLSEMLALVRAATEADFSHYKQNTVLRRIGRRMALHHMQDLQEYLRLLRTDRSEVEALYQDILIHVTSFFRQAPVFAVLKKKCFPQIAEAKAGGQVRFWVPGCASGEEAYSLAIAWAEYVGVGDLASLPFTVFATDINQRVIDRARAGVYPESIASDVSPERLERFFTPVEDGFRVVKSLRDACVFAKHDLTRDPPFSKIDLVSLRNVLIYLGPLLQHRIMPLLHFALRPRAFLLLGESESIGTFTDIFSPVDKKARIYTRRESVVALTVLPRPPAGGGTGAPSESAPLQAFDLSGEADRIVLDGYAPVGVIVDADFQIRQFRGGSGPYLQVAPGRASFDVLRMAREGLAGELRSALHEANQDSAPVERQNIRVLRDDGVVAVGFSVVPITSPSGERSFLILFRDMPPAREAGLTADPIVVSAADGTSAQSAAELERELSDVREYARSVLEDKEAANEELRSANEELQSANEELQSVNEELETTSEEVQSSNEELQSLNDELQATNEALDRREQELQDARDYARAVVDTVKEPLCVVDADFRVVSANASFYETFETKAEDTLGRDFFALDRGQWDFANLRELVSGVVRGKRDFQDFVVEREFARVGPRTMLLSGRRVAGDEAGREGNVLLAVFDITRSRRTEALSDALDAANLIMISTMDYQTILEGVLTTAVEVLACDDANLAVPEGASWVVGYSLKSPDEQGAEWIPEEGIRASSPLQLSSPNGSRLHMPLRSRGKVAGILTFGRTGRSAAFTDIERDFVHKLAPALSLALENAKLFSEEHRVSYVLQASLLPSAFPFSGVDVGVAYRPANEVELVGGDFYDLFPLGDGRVAVVVGDVSGKGVEAASLTGTVRAMLRSFASLDPSPALLLSNANELLLAQLSPELFVTVIVAVIDPASGKVTVSSAGHPPPMACGGEVRLLEGPPGLPLGAGGGTYREADFDLAAGEAVILYTDGLIEARRGGEFFGEEGVARALAGEDVSDVQGMVDRLVSSATQFAGGRLSDDLAVIAVRVGAESLQIEP